MDEKFALPAAGPDNCAKNPALPAKKYDITGRDRLLLPLTLAACTLAADSIILHDWGLGVTLTVLAWYALLDLRLGWGRLTAGSGKCLLTANVLLALWYALGSGWYFRLWNFGALLLLLPLHAAGCSAETHLPWQRPGMLGERFRLTISGLFRDLGAGFAALGSFGRKRWDLRRAAGVLFGCAGALALLAILIPVLLRADALFAHEMSALFTWELPELRFPQALGVGLVLTPFAFSLLWRLAYPREGKAAPQARQPRLPAAVFLLSLLALDGLYLLFLGVQSAGLFGGPGYLASRGLSYADWARSGFFQMVRVTVVNLSVLLGAVTWTKRERGFPAIRVAAAVLTGESFLLLGSAAWRMSLYVSAYGLSFKRCMTYWGMAVMAALFAFAAGKLAKPERSFCRLAFPFLLGAWLLIAYLPVDALVARDQVRRGSGDVEYLLYDLSYDSLAFLSGEGERVLAAGDGSSRSVEERIAERRAQAAGECRRWESWNLSAYLASRGGTE